MTQIIKCLENGNVLIITKENELLEVPKNKFEDGEFVQTSQKHYSQKEFTQVIEPRWCKDHWRYGEHFINKKGEGGGYCFTNPEHFFEKLTNPEDILIAKKLQLLRQIEEMNLNIKLYNKELDKVDYALDLIRRGA